MTKLKNNIIFPHLPKTAGTSMAWALRTVLTEGQELFHLDPNGRTANIPSQFETFSDNDCKFVFGHQVTEALIQSESDFIATTLRHPASRLISHFNMKVSSGKFTGNFENYMTQSTDPMCRWYVACFPSYVNDPFSSLLDQATEILACFDQVLFQETFTEDFEKLMETVLPGQPVEIGNQNAAGKSYQKISSTLEDSITNWYGWFKQDLLLYKRFLEKDKMKTESSILPGTQIFHRWWRPVASTWQVKSVPIRQKLAESFNQHELMSALMREAYNSNTNLNHALLDQLKWFCNQNMGRDDLLNCLDMLLTIQPQELQVAIERADMSDVQTPLAILLKEYYKQSKQKTLQLSQTLSDVWFELPANDARIYEGRANYYLSNNDQASAEKALIAAAALGPHRAAPYKKLGTLYETQAAKAQLLCCAEKVLELNPRANWAHTTIQKIMH